jgi:hypothetical protein
MATYYGTYGQKVQYLSSDPTDPQIGQVWYNSTSAVLKVRQTVATNAWASGGNLNTARSQISALGADATNVLNVGGYAYGPNAYVDNVEQYDGTSWTTKTGTPTSLGFRTSGGTVTAGIVMGGHDGPSPAQCITWNGTSWTAVNSINSGAYGIFGNGSQTAAFIVGSSEPPTRPNTQTETWNGTSWTVSPASLNTGRGNGTGTGPSSDGLAIGGGTADTEKWNGSTWTTTGSLTESKTRAGGSGGSAPSNSVLVAANSNPTPSTNTQTFNGTSWTNTTALSTGRNSGPGGGGSSSNNGLISGGNSPSIATTEEWTGTQTSNRTVTVS